MRTEMEDIPLFGGPKNHTVISIAPAILETYNFAQVMREKSKSHTGKTFTYNIERCECGKRFGVYDDDEQVPND